MIPIPDSHLSLTASKVLRALLREYHRRAKSSDNSRPDREFGSSTQIRDRFFPRWSVAAVDAACIELARAGLLSVLDFGQGVLEASLTAAAISAPGSFTQSLQKVLDFLGALRGLLPW